MQNIHMSNSAKIAKLINDFYIIYDKYIHVSKAFWMKNMNIILMGNLFVKFQDLPNLNFVASKSNL